MADGDLRLLDANGVYVAPSLLAADFSCLLEEVAETVLGGADVLHIDIMDGHFVPNLSMGPGIVTSLRPHLSLPFDVHLMVTHPHEYVKPFVKAGADHVTFHVEAESDVGDTIAMIHDLGCSAGLSVKPDTPASALEPWLGEIDLVLVMTVEPGFGGQSFMAHMMPKVNDIRQMIDSQDRPVHLEIDGGVNHETARLCFEAGANMLVAGTSVFRAPDGMGPAIQAIRGAVPVT